MEIRDAFFEWLAGVVIGIIPLIAHGLMHLALLPANGTEGSWAGDILFVAITTSGSSAVSVFTRFAKGAFAGVRLGATAIFLMTMTIVFLVASGMLYGAVATGHTQGYTLWLAWGFLVGACLASLSFEMGLATKIALAPLSNGEP